MNGPEFRRKGSKSTFLNKYLTFYKRVAIGIHIFIIIIFFSKIKLNPIAMQIYTGKNNILLRNYAFKNKIWHLINQKTYFVSKLYLERL